MKPITLGGKKYTVERVHKLRDDDGTRCDGLIDSAHSVVQLDDDQDDQSAFATLWHELIHAIKYRAGDRDTEHDEKEVEAIAQGVVDVLAHNATCRTQGAFTRAWRRL